MKEYSCWRASKEGRLYGSVVVAADSAEQAAASAYSDDYEIERLYDVDRYIVYAYDSAAKEDREYIDDVLLSSL